MVRLYTHVSTALGARPRYNAGTEPTHARYIAHAKWRLEPTGVQAADVMTSVFVLRRSRAALVDLAGAQDDLVHLPACHRL